MILIINRLLTSFILSVFLFFNVFSQVIPKEFVDPPREFSVLPFWFWNDTLKDQEILRQIADFDTHGVYGFVIHPRIGLPENVKWLGPEMIHAMTVAISEAARRGMYVVLYDEGMYPSGSSGGQVVERNPGHAARGLAKIDLKPGEQPVLQEGWRLITIIDRPGGNRMAVIDRPSGGVIRGLHYIGEGGSRLREESPAAGDILNPEAVTSFIELVYDRYAREFGKYFGNTIMGVFTDERPPDVGPNSTWWTDYKPYVDACRRLSWLNTDSKQICNIAILCEATWLPDKSAKICYQNQCDFNYLEVRQLLENAKVDKNGVHIAGMDYRVIIVDSLSIIPQNLHPLLKKLASRGRLLVSGKSKIVQEIKEARDWKTPGELIDKIDTLIPPDIMLSPSTKNIRCRHVEKGGIHYYMLFNEEESDVSASLKLQVKGEWSWADPSTARTSPSQEGETINFKPHEMKVLMITNN